MLFYFYYGVKKTAVVLMHLKLLKTSTQSCCPARVRCLDQLN